MTLRAARSTSCAVTPGLIMSMAACWASNVKSGRFFWNTVFNSNEIYESYLTHNHWPYSQGQEQRHRFHDFVASKTAVWVGCIIFQSDTWFFKIIHNPTRLTPKSISATIPVSVLSGEMASNPHIDNLICMTSHQHFWISQQIWSSASG